ncbi:hypothetical protein ACO0QE_000148 [Hanseniaspora vineae]
MSDNKVNKNYEGKLGQKKATVIITNMRLVLASETSLASMPSLSSIPSYNSSLPSSSSSSSFSSSKPPSSTSSSTLTVEYPQVIYNNKVFQKGKKISVKMLPPELVIPWIGENYLLLKFQPGKEQQPYLNYIYPWVLEIYCKTDIFALKDCFSKVILESRMSMGGSGNNDFGSANANAEHPNANTQANHDNNFVPLPKYEP